MQAALKLKDAGAVVVYYQILYVAAWWLRGSGCTKSDRSRLGRSL
jgi:hypothetical protein